MGNVVEAAFVLPAPDTLVMPEMLAIEPARVAVTGSTDPQRLSYQCSDANLDHHGYCDETAEDGDVCECRQCQHPGSIERDSDA